MIEIADTKPLVWNCSGPSLQSHIKFPIAVPEIASDCSSQLEKKLVCTNFRISVEIIMWMGTVFTLG